MISTHLCQVLGFVAMEPPVHLDPTALRNEKAKVFAAMRPLDPDRVVFGQYDGFAIVDLTARTRRVRQGTRRAPPGLLASPACWPAPCRRSRRSSA